MNGVAAACLLLAAGVAGWPVRGRVRHRVLARVVPVVDRLEPGEIPQRYVIDGPAPAAWRALVTRHGRQLVGPVCLAVAIAGYALAGPVAAITSGAYTWLGLRALVRRYDQRLAAVRRAAEIDALAGYAADLRAGLPSTVEPPDWSEPRGELARRASAALTLAERTGAPLAELLDRVEADARAADRVAAGLTAQSAGARATALLLAGLPGAGLALGVTIGADPVHVLLHEPVGAACALGALALQLTGLAWSQRLATPSGWAASRPVRRLESPLWPVARRRLRRLELVPAKPRVGLAGRAASAPVAGGFAGITVAIAVGGVPGLVAGVPVAFLVARGMRTLQARDRNAERLRAAADLPLAADLLGAVLRAGAPVDRSADAVGSALGGALGERFLRVARALRLGATSEEAWGHLADLESGPRLAGAAIRSATSGAAFAGALDRLAGDLRAARAAAADAAARRAGVLIVLPLGLCFLPAFILAGLVPVIVAVLRDVL